MKAHWSPHVTVAAVIPQGERFLFVEEEIINQHIVLNQPAGHLEPGETLIQAVQREVLEETAYDFTPEGLVGIYLFPSQFARVSYLRFCFYGQIDTHHPQRALDDGIIRVLWLTVAELQANRERLRTPVVMQCLQNYIYGKRYSLDCVWHAMNLTNPAIAAAEGSIEEE